MENKNYIFITGTSRGIGNSLTNLFLNMPDYIVYGYARTQTIKNKNYVHKTIDLSNISETQKVEFPELPFAKSVVLINNAGYLGEVVHFGERTNADINAVYQINAVAPSVLTNKFIKQYKEKNVKKIILNISSGAARHPYESWSTYCAAKAALDMMSKVIDTEQKKFNTQNPVKIFSVAPGIVDTKMQDEIREVKPENFSKVDTFISYKNNNQLLTPEYVAQKLSEIILNPDNYTEVILDIRNL